jgi:hypothetical protein
MQTQGRRFRFALLYLCAVVSVAAPQAARAQVNQFNFTRIAATLANFSAPAIDDGHLAFWATGPNGRQGLYTGRIGGPFDLVVDDTTPVPGTTAPLMSFGTEFGFEAGRVAFGGFNDEVRGAYLFENGAIRRIADTNTPLPSGTGNFYLLGLPSGLTPSVDNSQVVFAAVGQNSQAGVYLSSGGALTRIADKNTPVPGGAGTFSSFFSPVVHNSRIAFVDSALDGLYLHHTDNGTLSLVADSGTAMPGRNENFRDFNSLGRGLDMHSDAIAFLGTGATAAGVYRFNIASGALTAIADTDTVAPGGGLAKFERYFNAVSVDNGAVAFGYGTGFAYIPPATGPNETELYGVYTNLGGTLARVLDRGDMLDGKLVSRAHIGPGGLDGNQIAMTVDFEDGSNAVYVATPIPEPTTVALLISAAGLIAICVRAARTRKVDA